MSLANILPIAITFAYAAFYMFKLHHLKQMRQEEQTTAKVITAKRILLYPLKNIEIEYYDSLGNLHRKMLIPFKSDSIQLGDTLDIAYAKHKPEKIVVWNRQEKYYKRLLLWLIVIGIVLFITFISNSTHQ